MRITILFILVSVLFIYEALTFDKKNFNVLTKDIKNEYVFYKKKLLD
jgi:sugar phosphate permease